MNHIDWCREFYGPEVKRLKDKYVNNGLRDLAMVLLIEASEAFEARRVKSRGGVKVKKRGGGKVAVKSPVLHYDGKPLVVGQEILDFRGEKATYVGCELPMHEGSTGRIRVSRDGAVVLSYYPSVFNAEWK